LAALALCLTAVPDADRGAHRAGAVAGVRSNNPALAAAIRDGREASTTFAGLYDEVVRLGGIVYIEEGPCGSGVRACLVHAVTPVAPYRYLFINVQRRRAGGNLVPILGHEVVHALEVLREASIDTNAEIVLLFERIGRRRPTTLVFETRAAIEIERRIESELRGA